MGTQAQLLLQLGKKTGSLPKCRQQTVGTSQGAKQRLLRDSTSDCSQKGQLAGGINPH